MSAAWELGKCRFGGRWLLGAIRAHDDGRGCCLLGADVEVEVDLTQPGWSGSEPQGIISSIPSSSQAPSIRLLISSSLDVKSNFKVAVCSSLSAVGVGSTPGPMPVSFRETGTSASSDAEEIEASHWGVSRVPFFS